MIFRILLSGLAAFALLSGSCRQQAKKVPVTRDSSVYVARPYIESLLDTAMIGDFLVKHPRYQDYDSLVRNFYLKREYHLAWFNRDSLTEQVGSFMNMMRQNEALGLADSSLLNKRLGFLYDSLTVKGGRLESEHLLQQMELTLTSQFFLFAHKVWGGMTAGKAKDLEWFIPRKKMDMAALINSVLETNEKGLEEVEPLHPQYGKLRDYLENLEGLSGKVSWDSLQLQVKSYAPGDSARLIGQVKQRLALMGFKNANDRSDQYTASLDSLIKTYRLCNGLKSGGNIDRELVDNLNIPVKDRVRKILINMERLRWVPDTPGNYYLLVNIPGFMLYAYENDSLAWSMPVVVGKPVHQTVIFSGSMKYVVFSPYWNIPPGILANETLPAIKRNVSYLRKNNMEVVRGGKVVDPGTINWQKYNASNFPYMIRQKPGGNNSLGRVKFLFPNEYNIYLHDTPAKSLFSADSRPFSHGCIRVSRPQELAEYLLRRDSTWTSGKIAAAMKSGKEKYVTLKEPVMVYIGYFTAWVDSKGHLNFRPDVYGHDAKLSAMLFGK
ncbi:murein L,D-transpeptidase YcbB/YkuD [Anseongella ginsenosidimutans]|uniref:Murein L,D-transpeptidase YcbB/YkuD n=1 Tax=Anseongella ginsenosidimutans TaxID=496056 RepID=A0A4R3KVY5_9SPHI|nr:L,D-transpeptidase family protein [Anseongella ginsenosidimutans]QEC51551.1 L,D-transpeptidase family protein [Anseongella ginsenosidimutans]TCS88876.1 murein L,D-transpeptidase YcbB/YkuD [Anseongella ginsenosidimutans]